MWFDGPWLKFQKINLLIFKAVISKSRGPTAKIFCLSCLPTILSSHLCSKNILVYWYLFVYNNVGSIYQLITCYCPSIADIPLHPSVLQSKDKILSSARCRKSSKNCHLLCSLWNQKSCFSLFLLHMLAKKHTKILYIKVSKSRKQIWKFSFEPNELKYFCISALASKSGRKL